MWNAVLFKSGFVIFLKKSPQIFVYTYKLFTFASALDVCVCGFPNGI